MIHKFITVHSVIMSCACMLLIMYMACRPSMAQESSEGTRLQYVEGYGVQNTTCLNGATRLEPVSTEINRVLAVCQG